MMLTGLAGVLRGAGLAVQELDGWQTRGHGPMVDVRGVTCHHTAGGRSTRLRRSLDVVRDGRPGLPGPLAQTYLDIDGTWFTVAAGLAYHAGVSLRADQTNSHRIGVEAEAAGDGWDEDWPKVQVDSYARGCAAFADHYGFDLDQVLGHKETCSPRGRKIDPSFGMPAFRARVRAVDLSKPITTLEDDMQPTDKHKLTAADVAALGDPTLKVGDMASWDSLWRFPPAVARMRREQAARDGALLAAVQALGGGGTLSQEQLTQAAENGAQRALANLGQALVDDAPAGS